MKAIWIQDIFEEIVGKVNVELQKLPTPIKVGFEYGHLADVTKGLRQKDTGDLTAKGSKYPLIWMVEDFSEYVGQDANYCRADFQFVIACLTRPDYSPRDRKANTFLPILYPIYDEFFNQLRRSKALGFPPESFLKHVKTNRSFWGSVDDITGIGKGNLFSDYVDAIQIRRLNLGIIKTC